MNENHDERGRFASAGAAIHGVALRVRAELHKDRFTRLVPPGSKTDRAVKEAAAWSKMGLEKSAAMALGGPVAAGGVMLAQYTKWGGNLAREVGPRVLRAVDNYTTGRKR